MAAISHMSCISMAVISTYMPHHVVDQFTKSQYPMTKPFE